jgi:serine/threonine-protein kinase
LGVAVDAEGNVYAADSTNHRVRKITPGGTVTTLAGSGQVGLADGPALEATFSAPVGIALAASGVLYVADSDEEDPHPLRVRAVTPDGTVTTVAGSSQAGYKDGLGLDAQFKSPASLAVDSAGNVYVADPGNHRVRKIVLNP